MKISNSKKELAKIISENGGWCDGAEFSVSTCSGTIAFSKNKPEYTSKYGFTASGGFMGYRIELCSYLKNWHQCILSRKEYFHLYPAPDADGWIEWSGGECPVGEEQLVRIKVRGETGTARGKAGHWSWGHSGCGSDIIAYRLHKPEQAKTEPVAEAKPTIEQLAADYRNKQDEADSALSELEKAIAAIGFAITPIDVVAQEPELVITEWRDLQLGDIIEYVDGDIKNNIGMTGPVVEFAPDATDGMYVRMECNNGPNKGRLGWPRKWRFIHRPAK